MKLKIEISLDNDSLKDDNNTVTGINHFELNSIINKIKNSLWNLPKDIKEKSILDTNGNIIGKWKITK